MTENGSSHLTSGWLPHLVAGSCVAVLVVLFAAPQSVPPVMASQARGVAELAALLAAAQPEAARIDENLRSWPRFPPAEDTGRLLSGALAACSLASRSETQRLDLARRVYAITNGSAVSDADLAATLDSFRGAAAAARCAPARAVDIEQSLRRAARTDPRPRADWW